VQDSGEKNVAHHDSPAAIPQLQPRHHQEGRKN